MPEPIEYKVSTRGGGTTYVLHDETTGGDLATASIINEHEIEFNKVDVQTDPWKPFAWVTCDRKLYHEDLRDPTRRIERPLDEWLKAEGRSGWYGRFFLTLSFRI